MDSGKTPQVGILRFIVCNRLCRCGDHCGRICTFHQGYKFPLAGRLFLDYGFVSEKLLSDEELQTILSLRPEAATTQNGCRVYTMSQWLQAIYDGIKDTSKNEFDEDFPTYLRRQVKEQKITQKEMDAALSDREERMHFECQNS